MTDFLDYEGLSRFKEDLDGSINDYTTGINLCKGTRDFIQGNEPLRLGYSEDGFKLGSYIGLKKDADGFTEIYNKNGTNAFAYSPQIKGIKPDTDYTLSFKVRHDSGSLQPSAMYLCRIFCYDEKATAVDKGFLKTLTFTSDMAGFTADGVWKDIRIVFRTPNFDVNNENVFIGILFYTNHNLNSHSFKTINFVEDNINNPIWSPSPFDIDYINDETTGINLLRGTRDFTVGKKINTGNYPSLTGFAEDLANNNFTYTKDEDGFTVATITQTSASDNSKYVYSSPFEGNYGDIYTVYCEIKVSGLDTITNRDFIRAVFLNDNYNENSSLQLNIDSTMDVRDEEWFKFCKTFSLPSSKRKACLTLRIANGNVGSVSFRKLAVYKGRINNPIWSASPFDVVQVGDTLTNANIATPSETLSYVKGSTGSAVTTLPNDGIFIGELPNATTEEGNSTSTLPSEDRPLVGLLKPEQDPDEIEGDDKPWQMM